MPCKIRINLVSQYCFIYLNFAGEHIHENIKDVVSPEEH